MTDEKIIVNVISLQMQHFSEIINSKINLTDKKIRTIIKGKEALEGKPHMVNKNN